MGFFKFIALLSSLWVILQQTFDITELGSKEGFQKLLGKFREIFGQTKITPERAQKFIEVAVLVKKAGGIDALHEFLREADQSGALNTITSIFDEKEGISAGGLERSSNGETQKIFNIGSVVENLTINTPKVDSKDFAKEFASEIVSFEEKKKLL